MAHSRRDFLKGSIGAISLSMLAPKLFLGRYGSSSLAHTANSSAGNRILVVLQLDGGNDGLNTVVPYADKAYYAARPTLGIPEADVLKLDANVGLNPMMIKFKGLFDQGHIAIVQNVGYPDPDLSHFRSRIIYQRADPTTQESREQLGWLGKYADQQLASEANPLGVVNIGSSLSKALINDKVAITSVQDFQLYQFLTDVKYPGDRNNQINTFNKDNGLMGKDSNFLYVEGASLDALTSSTDLQAGIQNYSPTITYPKDTLGKQLQMAAQVIAGNLGTNLIYNVFSGFDTHSGQKADQDPLLGSLSDSFDAFFADLTRLGRADDVLVMAFTEFGRRVHENGSGGTDHGTAGPLFVMGNKVKGGLYGQSPSLTDLDSAGNVKFDVDFRAVYGTILQDWLNSDPTPVLGGTFENVGFINK